MSGRFFKPQLDSDSESEESETDIQAQRPAPAATATYAFSDEEEETKRVVRTEKEKRYEELNGIMKLIRNHTKIKDISKMLTSFENLTKAFLKAKPVIEKEENGITPRFYIKCLVELEDFITDVWEDRDGRKNMSKNNSKSLATLRQKLRKYNKDFESDILNYRENPDEERDDEDDLASDDESLESDDDSDNKFTSKFAKKKDDLKSEDIKADDLAKDDLIKSKFLKVVGSDDEKDSEESDWGSSSDESSLSSDFENQEVAAYMFLKKEPGESKETKKREKKLKEKKEGIKKKTEEEEDEGEWEKVKGGVVTGEKPKMFGKDEEISHQTVVKKLSEILAMRGKKRIHRSDQIEMLTELLEISETHKLGPAMKVKIALGIVSALLDYNTNISTCMKSEMWEKCIDFCNLLVDTLIAHPEIAVGENIAEESQSFATPPYRVHGCALTLVERMDEEFTKILQAVDAHSPDYIERLKDEKKVCMIIERLQSYLETDQRGTSPELCRIYILRIDHLYYKFDPEVFKRKQAKELEMNGFKEVEVVIADNEDESKENKPTENEKPRETEKGTVETSLEIMDKMCKFIYAKDTTDRIRTQAILCHIYHHAVHDNWFEARDLMLMSHLQHNIIKSDIPLQIIYNRALVQLGLCAFRHGNIKDAHADLLDIQILGRAKELLAQGLLPKQQERTAEQEKLEKRRLLPFHKHINLELLECVYLVSAMLLEIPDVAANEYSVRKKMISRSFYNQLRKNEEQPLVGLPESMREHVVAASKAMRVGNWKACRDFIINDKMNSKVWNLFHQPDKVREMLVQKIREESLRAYLFTYSHIYDSISLLILSEMFDLEKTTVHSIISKMIINEELMASLDEPTQTLVMHRTEPSRIQGLSLQLADKVNTLVDHNEKIWEMKQIATFGGQSNRLGFSSGRDQGQGYRDHGQRQERGYMERSNREQRRASQYRNQ